MLLALGNIYGALAPTIDALVGSSNFNHVNKHVMKGLSGYETIKNKVTIFPNVLSGT